MNKKKLFPLALVPLAATSLQAQSNIQTGRTDKRPNIILFMVDDMGQQSAALGLVDPGLKMIWVGRILPFLSGHKKRITTNYTKRRTWNDWPVRE